MASLRRRNVGTDGQYYRHCPPLFLPNEPGNQCNVDRSTNQLLSEVKRWLEAVDYPIWEFFGANIMGRYERLGSAWFGLEPMFRLIPNDSRTA
jgi:hypothetical protein